MFIFVGIVVTTGRLVLLIGSEMLNTPEDIFDDLVVEINCLGVVFAGLGVEIGNLVVVGPPVDSVVSGGPGGIALRRISCLPSSFLCISCPKSSINSYFTKIK